MKPVSVIIVNFNGGPLLSQCVRSVLNSSVPVEIIVSDNQSTDGSLIELRRVFALAENVRIIENTDNLGFATANNIALRYAQGDSLLFLNPDCIIQPDTIEKMLSRMEPDPLIGMAGCLIQNPDGSEQPGCRRSIPTPWRTFIRMTRLTALSRYDSRFESYIQTGQPMPDAPVEVEAISGAFMLVRRAALEKVGPMDEGYFMHCEDLDWCMRFHQSGLKIVFVPDISILHVGGVCSASRPISVEYYKHIGMVRFYRKFFRHQYSAIVMLLVMVAIGFRFIGRAASTFSRPMIPRQALPQTIAPFLGKTRSQPVAVEADPDRCRVIVTGATSLIGDYLLPDLIKAGYHVHALSRNPPAVSDIPHLTWHKVDISAKTYPEPLQAEILIHLAPLSTLPFFLERMADDSLKRILAFGSTSLFTKYESGYEQERNMAHGLRDAENQLAEFCSRRGIQWTVFRPTLVYHLGRDKNITTIAEFIRRFGFFPMVGRGDGLRQPVHAEDLALACISALDNSATFGKAYNLSGGEILAYRDMILRLTGKMGRRCQIINIPLPVLRIFLRCMSFIPQYRHLTPEMANRINRDMVFDHQEAALDFGFAPRDFMDIGHRENRELAPA